MQNMVTDEGREKNVGGDGESSEAEDAWSVSVIILTIKLRQMIVIEDVKDVVLATRESRILWASHVARLTDNL